MTGVSKRFGATQSLNNLSLCVERGAVFGFLGENGAGKTTTLRTLLGLVRPDTGSICVLSHNPRVDAPRIRALVGVLLEADGLYDRLSGWNNLDFHARIHKLGPSLRARRIQELLESFGLWERQKDMVVNWSKGMRQKLAIARALIHRPQLLLLDEPFSSLDPAAAVDLRESVMALAREEHVTVMLTTHDLAHVEKACSQVAVIQAGRVIAAGAPEQLIADSGSLEVNVSGDGLCAQVLQSLQDEGLLSSFRFDGRAARITCAREARPHIGTELVKRGVRIEELHTVRTTLEEAFLSLVSVAPQQAGA